MIKLKNILIMAIIALAFFQTMPIQANALEVETQNQASISVLERIVELLQQINELKAQLIALQTEIESKKNVEVIPLPEVIRSIRVGENFTMTFNELISVKDYSIRIRNKGHVSCTTNLDQYVVPEHCVDTYKLEVYRVDGSITPRIVYAAYNKSVPLYSDLSIIYKGYVGGTGVAVYPQFLIEKNSVIYPTNNPPVINGVSGPTNLEIGEQGTWKVNASDSDGDDLSYYVDWGDTLYYPAAASENIPVDVPLYQQDTTFTHSYNREGNYKILFTVKDENGEYATKTTITVNVIESESVEDINVLYPNGGETLYRGQLIKIRWDKYDEPVSIRLANSHVCPDGLYCAMPLIYYPDWTITNYIHSQNGTFTWEVGKGMLDDFHQTTYIQDGNYKVRVCGLNSGQCDLSDNAFRLGTIYY